MLTIILKYLLCLHKCINKIYSFLCNIRLHKLDLVIDENVSVFSLEVVHITVLQMTGYGVSGHIWQIIWLTAAVGSFSRNATHVLPSYCLIHSLTGKSSLIHTFYCHTDLRGRRSIVRTILICIKLEVFLDQIHHKCIHHTRLMNLLLYIQCLVN